jgi:hypothetical protein
MDWWRRLFGRRRKRFPPGVAYVVPFRLYNIDGSRSIEVRVKPDGLAYYVEQERVEEDVFKNRGSGKEVGPFDSPEAAENAAVGTAWFNGRENEPVWPPPTP